MEFITLCDSSYLKKIYKREIENWKKNDDKIRTYANCGVSIFQSN